jgi:putative ABC transport system permease protein
MDTFMQDLKFGFRMLRKGGWVTFTAIGILSLAIGVNTGIFSIVDKVLWRPLSYGSSDQLVRLWESYGQDGWGSVSPPNFTDWQQQNDVFSGLAAYMYASRNLQNVDTPERLATVGATANLFSMLDVSPLMGRTFVAEDGQLGRPNVVVLSEEFWRKHFAGKKDVLGNVMTLDGASYMIVGVMPSRFQFPPAARIDLWTTLQLPPEQMNARGMHMLQVVGRLKPAVALASASSEMRDIAKRIEQQFPQQQKGRSVRMQSLRESVVGGSRLPLLLLFGAVGLVLLITCADVASLLLARTAARNREFSVRLALGAPKPRIVQLLLIESLALAVISSIVALGLAYACTQGLASLAELQIPFISNVHFDFRIFSVLLLLTLGTAFVCGIGPGFTGFRMNALKGLKDGPTQVGVGTALSRVYGVLMTLEVAFSVFLLVGAGLLVRTFVQLESVKPGFDSKNVLTAQISLPKKAYSNPAAAIHFYDQALEQMQHMAGVNSAGLISLLPMQDWGLNATFGIQGRPTQNTGTPPSAEVRVVSGEYFHSLGIPLRSGRMLGAEDTMSRPHALLINETLQRKYFPSENPVGQYLLFPEPWQIVGVVADVRQARLERDTLAELYLPYGQVDELGLLTDVTLVLKTNIPPNGMAAALRGAIQSVDKNQPIYNLMTMDDVVSGSVAGLKLYVVLAVGFAILALILAIAGVYGVIAYTTVQRTREFGLRLALGAQRRNIILLVLRTHMKKVLAGLAAGVLASLAFLKVLTAVLFGVKPTDPATFVAVCVLVCACSFIASYVPARRASQVDPISSLRYE